MMRDTTEALERWLAQGGRRIGQVAIAPLGAGWELRHADDTGRANLAEHTRWQEARTLANLDDAGRYRALKTAPTLRRGWRLVLPGLGDLRRALEYFYPAMLGVWLSHLEGELAPVDLRTTLGRQTGMYRVTQKLSEAAAQTLIGRVCRAESCLKTVLWPIAPGRPITALPAEKFAVREPETTWPMLCQEACNILVAEARKVVKGEAA